MPHRVGKDDEPIRDLQGNRGSAHPDLLRNEHGRRPVHGRDRSSRATHIGATTFSSTNTFTATMAPGSARAIRPAGPDWSPRSSSYTVFSIPSGPWSLARRRALFQGLHGAGEKGAGAWSPDRKSGLPSVAAKDSRAFERKRGEACDGRAEIVKSRKSRGRKRELLECPATAGEARHRLNHSEVCRVAPRSHI